MHDGNGVLRYARFPDPLKTSHPKPYPSDMLMDERQTEQWRHFVEEAEKVIDAPCSHLVSCNMLHRYGEHPHTHEEQAAWDRRQERARRFGGRSYLVGREGYLAPVIITKDLGQWYRDAEKLLRLLAVKKKCIRRFSYREISKSYLTVDRHLIAISGTHDLRDPITEADTLEHSRERAKNGSGRMTEMEF